MHKVLKICGYSLLSIFSFDLLIAIADWSARWEWVRTVLDAHPHLALFVRTPLVMLILLGLGFAFLWAERKLGLPRLGAKLLNSLFAPRLRTVTMEAVFADAKQSPGWDQHKSDWDWFLEIALVNESGTPTTIEEVKVVVTIVKKFFGWKLPQWWPRAHIVRSKVSDDFSHHALNKKQTTSFAELDRAIPSLMGTIKGFALTKGIGYRGWIHVELPQITRHDLNRCLINIWLYDALEGKHLVRYKGNENDWDKSISIVETNTHH